MVALWFLVFWGYFVLFEALWNGRTPGKRRLGIRAVMDTGHSITFAAAVIRNLSRLVDVQPLPSYFVGLLFVFFHGQNKRLGDIVAGTIVVRDRAQDVALAGLELTPKQDDLDLGTPELADDEYRLVEQVLTRLDTLTASARRRFLGELEARFAPRYPQRNPDPALFLTELYDRERARRRGALGSGRADQAGRRGGTERFIALKQDSWERFRRRVSDVEKGGIRRLTGREITAFAAAYREVAADLARARTYGVDPRVMDYLARIVSSGHNALYGTRRARRRSWHRLLLATLPATTYRARGYVVVAFLMFVLPGVAGYTLIRERPPVAHDILPDEMIARAEAGQSRAVQGRGYAEAPDPLLPLFASSIIANNVQVAFAAFAFGILAGAGTLLVLAFNGLFFGAVLGLFANYGLAGWLLTFVAGHGVLELTAIFIAGGAGLLVGHAVIAPGDLRRRDALVINGQRAVELVGVATVMLVLAGLIEGFLSASDAPPTLKAGVSAATGVLIVLVFMAGRQAACQGEDEEEGTEGAVPLRPLYRSTPSSKAPSPWYAPTP